jgi:hypothetical protein
MAAPSANRYCSSFSRARLFSRQPQTVHMDTCQSLPCGNLVLSRKGLNCPCRQRAIWVRHPKLHGCIAKQRWRFSLRLVGVSAERHLTKYGHATRRKRGLILRAGGKVGFPTVCAPRAANSAGILAGILDRRGKGETPSELDFSATSRPMARGKRSEGTGVAVPGHRIPTFLAHPACGQ